MKSAIHIVLMFVCLTLFSINGISQQGNCKMGSLPTVMFPAGSSKLTQSAIAILKIVAEELKNNPQCNLQVTAFGGVNKKSQQLSWEHTYAVIMHLNEKQGISLPRLIFKYGELEGPEVSVDLTATTEDGPTLKEVPPPHPQLRRQ